MLTRTRRFTSGSSDDRVAYPSTSRRRVTFTSSSVWPSAMNPSTIVGSPAAGAPPAARASSMSRTSRSTTAGAIPFCVVIASMT